MILIIVICNRDFVVSFRLKTLASLSPTGCQVPSYSPPPPSASKFHSQSQTTRFRSAKMSQEFKGHSSRRTPRRFFPSPSFLVLSMKPTNSFTYILTDAHNEHLAWRGSPMEDFRYNFRLAPVASSSSSNGKTRLVQPIQPLQRGQFAFELHEQNVVDSKPSSAESHRVCDVVVSPLRPGQSHL